jgi:hypothetical protein
MNEFASITGSVNSAMDPIETPITLRDTAAILAGLLIVCVNVLRENPKYSNVTIAGSRAIAQKGQLVEDELPLGEKSRG